MVRADGIYLFDLVAERHRFVNQELNEMIGSGSSGQQLEFSVDPIDPRAADASANLGGRGSVREKQNRE